jgi:hypothetical protein
MASGRGGRERYRVFLSYSHKDRWVAKQCREKIKRSGKSRVEVFWDEEGVAGGQVIPERIRREIQECDELVVLLTPNSKDRDWVKTEVSAAWGLDKLIVPILLNVAPQEMLDILRSCKCLDLNNDDFEVQYLRQLAARTERRMR